VVVIGADPSQKKQTMQEADVMIRRRAQAGAKVIVVSTEKTDLAHHANATCSSSRPAPIRRCSRAS